MNASIPRIGGMNEGNREEAQQNKYKLLSKTYLPGIKRGHIPFRLKETNNQMLISHLQALQYFYCLMSRFQQSNTNFYSTISYSRPSTSDVKFGRTRIASTAQGFLPNNSTNSFRPQTANGMFRSSSSSFRNTKGKLQTLADQLNSLLEDTKQTRTATKEMQLHLQFLKEDLNQQGVEPLRLQLTQAIKVLDKTVQIRQRSDCLKFQALNQTCIALNRNTKQLRAKMGNLNERLFEIENMLGFHGLRDKLKY